MDTVTIDGKVYVRAVQAAGEVGYAPDYVGQLCRSGKLEAKRLGKTWYVLEGALIEHKQSNPRKNAGTMRRNLKQQRERIESQRRTFGSSARPTPLVGVVRYSYDDATTIPEITPEAPRTPVIKDVEESRVEVPKEQEVEPQNEASETQTVERGVDDSSSEATDERDALVSVRRIHTPQKSERRKFLERTLSDHVAHTEQGVGRRTEQRPTQRVARRPRGTAARALAVAAPRERSLASRLLLVPAVLAVAVLFAALSVFLETRWVYSKGEGASERTFATKYNLTSLAALKSALRNDF